MSQAQESSTSGHRRKISGAFGSRKFGGGDSASHEIEGGGSINDFGSNPGLPYQQDKLNTNLPQVDAQDDQLDQGPPSNITPLNN